MPIFAAETRKEIDRIVLVERKTWRRVSQKFTGFIGRVTRIYLILLQTRVVDPSCKKIDPDPADDENPSIKFGSFIYEQKFNFVLFPPICVNPMDLGPKHYRKNKDWSLIFEVKRPDICLQVEIVFTRLLCWPVILLSWKYINQSIILEFLYLTSLSVTCSLIYNRTIYILFSSKNWE